MAVRSPHSSAPQQGASRRQQRADRILDAASTLILRWGYNKTTVDDIAGQAGVAKGTIYLHWKTREDLFRALVQRENVEWIRELRRRITTDPEGSTLRGVIKHSALGLMKRPLLKALLLRDMDVIGKLAKSEKSSALAAEKLAGFNAYLDLLRERGLVRTDLSLRQQVYALGAVFMGFLLLSPLMPDDLKLCDEEMADLMAETAHRALQSGRTVSSEDLQAVSDIFMQYLDRYEAVAQEQFRQECEGGDR